MARKAKAKKAERWQVAMVKVHGGKVTGTQRGVRARGIEDLARAMAEMVVQALEGRKPAKSTKSKPKRGKS